VTAPNQGWRASAGFAKGRRSQLGGPSSTAQPVSAPWPRGAWPWGDGGSRFALLKVLD